MADKRYESTFLLGSNLGDDALGAIELTNFDVMNEPAIQQAIGNNNEPAATPYDRVHFSRLLAHFRAADRALAIDRRERTDDDAVPMRRDIFEFPERRTQHLAAQLLRPTTLLSPNRRSAFPATYCAASRRSRKSRVVLLVRRRRDHTRDASG